MQLIGLIKTTLDACALQLLDLFKSLAQIIHHPGSHIIAVKLLLALIAHTFDQFAQPHSSSAIVGANTLLHQAAQRLL